MKNTQTQAQQQENLNPLFDLGQIINVNNLQKNSIIVFRIKELTPEIYKTIEALNYVYGDKFKEKNVSFMVLKPDTKLEVISETQMNSAGWYKKGKIITLS